MNDEFNFENAWRGSVKISFMARKLASENFDRVTVFDHICAEVGIALLARMRVPGGGIVKEALEECIIAVMKLVSEKEVSDALLDAATPDSPLNKKDLIDMGRIEQQSLLIDIIKDKFDAQDRTIQE